MLKWLIFAFCQFILIGYSVIYFRSEGVDSYLFATESSRWRSLLVWDSFQAYLTESVKADLQQRKIDVAVIPGGLTPVLQPLDKCLNKPFKDNMWRKYLNWMMTGPFEYTPVGKKKALSKNLVVRWVKQSWEEIVQNVRDLKRSRWNRRRRHLGRQNAWGSWW